MSEKAYSGWAIRIGYGVSAGSFYGVYAFDPQPGTAPVVRTALFPSRSCARKALRAARDRSGGASYYWRYARPVRVDVSVIEKSESSPTK